MRKSRSTFYALSAALLALVAAAVSGYIYAPAFAGSGCCAAKDGVASPAASLQPVANIAQGGAQGDARVACPYSKAASARTAGDASSCSVKGEGKAPAAVKAAMLRWQKANSDLSQAVDSGASDRQVRELAVKAGGAYAEMARVAASSYRQSNAGAKLAADSGQKAGFLQWVSGACGSACPLGACCGSNGAAPAKQDEPLIKAEVSR